MSGIDRPLWVRISPLLDELLDVDEAARAARLQQIRLEDGAMADEVARLLAQQAAVETADFLQGSVLALPVGASLSGTVVGSYTLDRVLGQGGMGTVWLARRSDGHFESLAAIKFLNLSLLDRGGAVRFRREGQVLARLTHPNVARLIDAGIHAGVQPYLILEYVDGEPIDQWCNSHGLDIRGRLYLYTEVLTAVAHAHSNLVLHRDLKPSNILVTPGGHVKLLDFGIARLLESDAQGGAALTRQAGHAFTPEYAAPEEIAGGELTTATDVFSLGVVLYELLVGARPYRLERTSVAALIEAIASQEPPLASVAAVNPADRRLLRGDLDAILNLALKKRPDERYHSVTEMMADIRRHLDGAPVRAQPDRLAYRFGKFVRRHRVGVSAAAAILLSVLAGASASLWQAREATRQRDSALALAARNEAVVDFVNEMLTEVAPTDRPVQMSDLLERSLSMLTSSGGDPEHQAAILGMLSNYFLSTGDPAKAWPLLERALDLTRESGDRALHGTLLCESADAALLLGRPADAAGAIAEGMKLSSSNPLAAARCLQKRATIAQNANDPTSALEYALQAQVRLEESHVAKPELEATLLADIAAAHYLAGRAADADRYFAASLAKYAELGRDESPATISVRNNWGVASEGAGDYRRAFELYDEALRIARERAIDGEAPSYLLANRAQVLTSLGRYPEALAADGLAIEAATRSGHALARIKSRINRAATYVEMGDLVRAEQELVETAAEVGSSAEPDSPQAMSIRYWRARLADVHGDWSEAVGELSAVIDHLEGRQMLGSTLARARRTRAHVYLKQGNVDGAMADTQRALEIARALQGGRSHSGLTGLALLVSARVHEARGAIVEARAAAAEALPHLARTLGEAHPETKAARSAAM